MKNFFWLLAFSLACTGCTETENQLEKKDQKELPGLFESYYQERMKLFPLEATDNGETLYNDRLVIDFTDDYIDTLRSFYSKYLTELKRYDIDALDARDKTNCEVFRYELETSLEGLDHRFTTYIPFQQFWGLPLTMGQLGSGDGNQPFKTTTDYENWLKRASVFPAWADSAIAYFRKGMNAGLVLPQKLVIKMIPQMEALVTADPAKSIFYGPVTKMPASFDTAQKNAFTKSYTALIIDQLVPAYRRLAEFLKNEYLPKASQYSGIGELPGGAEYYRYISRYWTTTGKTPDEIYETGLREVSRIRSVMDSVKTSVGFKGSLDSFFVHLRTDKKFRPYTSAEEVLGAYRSIQSKIEPQLPVMFGKFPKTKFEIRQTEAFRAASASAEYNPGSPDGKRPGIFYIPIVDARSFNVTSGMENLFLHEAIPGHHYQISLQSEDTSLPKFRRFLWYAGYGEGWALYTESLGKELGLYKDPYQYMGALGDDIHRAIRLVVDVGLHHKGMSREEAIRYMMANEAISEDGATAEIERYMAIPGQALSYKIGALKIRELREKYQKQLGAKFSLAAFHDEFLSFGCVPLDVLEKRMNAWADTQGK